MNISGLLLLSWPLRTIIVILLSYLLGSIPFGLLLYRLRTQGDLRETGSGNIGATNVLRSAGLPLGLATLFCDALKGYLAVVLASWLTQHSVPLIGLAAFVAIAGHIFSVFLAFRGGKGVATGLGAFLALAPLAILCSILIFALVYAVKRYVSFASILSVGAFPFILLLLDPGNIGEFAAAIASVALIIYRHKGNIQRLREGTELTLSIPGKSSQERLK